MGKLTWHAMCKRLTSMTEEEISDLLEEEVTEHKRPAMVRRLHQRYSTLRAARERAVLMEEIKK